MTRDFGLLLSLNLASSCHLFLTISNPRLEIKRILSIKTEEDAFYLHLLA